MKHIKDANTKAAVGKTLEGLASFYTRHPNIRALLFVILAESNVRLDDPRWEQDYSYMNGTPAVITVIIRKPR